MSATAPELKAKIDALPPGEAVSSDMYYHEMTIGSETFAVKPVTCGGFERAANEAFAALVNAYRAGHLVDARLQAGNGITEEQVEMAERAIAGYAVRNGATKTEEGVHLNGVSFDLTEAVRLALEAASPLAPRQAPEGFVTVPVEPTDAMQTAFWREAGSPSLLQAFRQGYIAMLAASPAAPGDAGGACEEAIARVIARALGHNDETGMHWERYALAARLLQREFYILPPPPVSDGE